MNLQETKAPPQPCPSWEVIEQTLETGGWPAYLCALRIVFSWCQTLSAQMTDLQATSGSRSMLPGSIPETGVIHMPSSAIDGRTLLTGEES